MACIKKLVSFQNKAMKLFTSKRIQSGVVGGGSGLAASTSPIGVEEFAAWFVGAFVSVGAKVVALCLEKVGGESFGTVAIVVGQG